MDNKNYILSACPISIHASKQRPKKSKKLKMVQNHEFQSQKGKNKYNTFEQRIKKSQ